MELVQKQSKIKVATKMLTIIATMALSYYIITMSTPGLSLTKGGEICIRFAQALKGFYLATPAASAGIMTGAYLVNLTTGRMGTFGILPIVQLFVGLGVYWAANKGKHSHIKNIILLTLAGVITGLGTSIVQSALIAHGFQGMFFKVFTGMLFIKISGEILATLTGYPLYLLVRGGHRKDDNK